MKLGDKFVKPGETSKKIPHKVQNQLVSGIVTYDVLIFAVLGTVVYASDALGEHISPAASRRNLSKGARNDFITVLLSKDRRPFIDMSK